MRSQPQLVDPVIDGTVKGWPDLRRRASAVDTRLGLSIRDLPTPVLTLREGALDSNIRTLAHWCETEGLLLAPHAKTSLALALLSRQLQAGAWGLTVADVRQARIALAAGARRILIANELVRAADLEWVAAVSSQELAEISVCVDSDHTVAKAAAAARNATSPLRVLVEVGFRNGRCGARSLEEACNLAERVARAPGIALCGIEAYEGQIGPGDPDGRVRSVDAFLERVLAVAERCAPWVETEAPLLTAGGSAYFDRVAAVLREPSREMGWSLMLRSGCYVTHDHGLYEREGPHRRAPGAPAFEPAIEVYSSVISRPQDDQLVLNCGRRDVSYDAGLPVAIDAVRGAPDELTVVGLNDQHALVTCPPRHPLRAGDTVVLGVSHPCTALERWRVIPIIDDGGQVVAAAPTYF